MEWIIKISVLLIVIISAATITPYIPNNFYSIWLLLCLILGGTSYYIGAWVYRIFFK